MSRFQPIATIARDGLCGLAHELLEVDPRPAALRRPREVLCRVPPGFLNSCHTQANVTGTLASVAVGSQLEKICMTFYCFDGRIQQLPVCTTGQAGGVTSTSMAGPWVAQKNPPLSAGAMSTPARSSVGSDPLNQISCTTFDRFQPL